MQIPATPKTRLFSPDVLVACSELWLTGAQAKYVTRVLRLKAADTLVMFDGKGGQYGAAIKAFQKDRVLLQVGELQAGEVESPLAIHLVQGVSRSGRMDIVIQKSTELGVHRITPVITEFSVIRLDGDRASKRHQHWQRVSQSACEQCGRNTLPEIDMPEKLHSWLSSHSDDRTTRIMLAPGSSESITALQAPLANVELLVGPEGGLSDAERAQCKESGFRPVSLGPRVLRTETAALAGIAVLQAVWGDLK
jgi:16S rRNA (uracil1498-N3)-methyltransferase